MKYANILAKFYFEPWGIRPDKHVAMGRALQDYLKNPGPVEASMARPQRRLVRRGSGAVIGPTYEDGSPMLPQMEIRNGIALIPVQGVLGKHLSFLELWCGGCDYDIIAEMIDAALSDSSVRTIVFDINSPGGMVTGLAELCEKIRECGLRTIAYADCECCSCAFWIAMVCDEVYFAPSCCAGCVGVYIAGMDTSRAWETEGYKLELFRSGSLKAIGLDGKEWTDDEREFLQASVDRQGEKFRAAVRESRGNIPDSLMQGQWFDGEQCCEYALADGLISDLPQLLAALQD